MYLFWHLTILFLNTFSISLTLATDTGIGLLRTETVYAYIIASILLAGRAHLMLLHQRQKSRAADVAWLEKMCAMLLLQFLQCHLHRHSTGITEMFFRCALCPKYFKLLLTGITGTDTGLIADRIFLVLALGHSYKEIRQIFMRH